MSWHTSTSNGFLLKVWVTPNAKITKILGTITRDDDNTYLKISVCAPPENGKATKEVCLFLSKLLKIPISSCECIKGHSSRFKMILVKTTDLEALKKGS
ncbi:MAG TPA: DUF167 domain-containing protein [Alphaproteobacteria bacterium]|nr:DUF167 domain-containing protein [Alphaproteobacteria bacterium]